MSLTVKMGKSVEQLFEAKMVKKREAFAVAVSDAKTQLVLRTADGKDVNDNVFAPYTPKYAEFKGKPNSKGKSRKVSPPDLTFTGEMLSSIQTKIEQSGNVTTGIIYFTDSLNSKKARGNMEKRKFFDLSAKQLEQIKKRTAGA